MGYDPLNLPTQAIGSIEVKVAMRINLLSMPSICLSIYPSIICLAVRLSICLILFVYLTGKPNPTDWYSLGNVQQIDGFVYLICDQIPILVILCKYHYPILMLKLQT